MNNAQMSARVGLFFLFGIALIWITVEALHNGGFRSKKGYELIAGFGDLKELKVGDEIRMAGVKIGAVGVTRLKGRRAEAVLNINKEVKVASDAVATITAAGLLGSNYIAITIGSEGVPSLNAGDEIKTKNTPGMSEIMGSLGEVGDQIKGALGSITGSVGGENGLFTKIDKIVTDSGPKLTETISNLRDISSKINTGDGTLGKLVNDAKLHDELLAAIEEIKGAAGKANGMMADAQDIFAKVKRGEGTLGTLIYNDEVGNNIKVVTSNLKEVSDKLASGQGTLGKLINDDSLFNTAQGSLKKLDRAVDGLGDSGPISALGVAANALF